MSVRDAADVPGLGPFLASHPFRQVYPPGQRIRYSDYNTSLVGYIVEKTAGVPFDRYVEENVFRPLGMRRSSFARPWPPELAADLAMGYLYAGRYRPRPAGETMFTPAAGLLTTAEDMGRFMIAHLQAGRFGDRRILAAETAEEMHRRHFAPHPRLAGLTYGFWERVQNGHRALEHMGEGFGFANLLYLMPDANVGFFITTNRRDFSLHLAFTDRFLNSRSRTGSSTGTFRLNPPNRRLFPDTKRERSAWPATMRGNATIRVPWRRSCGRRQGSKSTPTAA